MSPRTSSETRWRERESMRGYHSGHAGVLIMDMLIAAVWGRSMGYLEGFPPALQLFYLRPYPPASDTPTTLLYSLFIKKSSISRSIYMNVVHRANVVSFVKEWIYSWSGVGGISFCQSLISESIHWFFVVLMCQRGKIARLGSRCLLLLVSMNKTWCQ